MPLGCLCRSKSADCQPLCWLFRSSGVNQRALLTCVALHAFERELVVVLLLLLACYVQNVETFECITLSEQLRVCVGCSL